MDRLVYDLPPKGHTYRPLTSNQAASIVFKLLTLVPSNAKVDMIGNGMEPGTLQQR